MKDFFTEMIIKNTLEMLFWYTWPSFYLMIFKWYFRGSLKVDLNIMIEAKLLDFLAASFF